MSFCSILVKVFKLDDDGIIAGVKGAHPAIPPREGVGKVVVKVTVVLVMEGGTDHRGRVTGDGVGKVFVASMPRNASYLVIELVDEEDIRVDGEDERGDEKVGLLDDVADLGVGIVGPRGGDDGFVMVGVVVIERLGVQEAVTPVEPGVIDDQRDEKGEGNGPPGGLKGSHGPAFGLGEYPTSEKKRDGGQGKDAGFDLHGDEAPERPGLNPTFRMTKIEPVEKTASNKINDENADVSHDRQIQEIVKSCLGGRVKRETPNEA